MMATQLFNENGIVLTRFSLGTGKGIGYQITVLESNSFVRLTRDQAISLLSALNLELYT